MFDFVHLIYFFLSLQYASLHGQDTFAMYELYSQNEINGNEILTLLQSSEQVCVFKCHKTYGCLSVNYHKGNKTCVLTDYYPLDGTKTGIPQAGWNIYFRRTFGKIDSYHLDAVDM
jgi:hypothetical protein